VDIRLLIRFNPETGSKTINAVMAGVGPICRLDVDGAEHKCLGRSHKHTVRGPRCPEKNLRDGVSTRQDLAGKSLRDVFDEYCRLARIEFAGTFHEP